jgi:UDP-glucose 4-epimerase
LVGHRPSSFSFNLSKPEGVTARAASVDLANNLLNWQPTIKFEEGIRKTVDWYSSQVDLNELKLTLEAKLFERG